MGRQPNSREVILNAAEMVVVEVGAAHLTLDAVAQKAGVSKGGLLYNFPTKGSLLEAMVARFIERSEEARTKALKHIADGPGRELKSYIIAGLSDDVFRPNQVNTALLAAVSNNPELLSPVRDHYHKLFAEITKSSEKFELAAIVSFAVDGLWFLELLQLAPLNASQRRRVITELLRLADGAG